MTRSGLAGGICNSTTPESRDLPLPLLATNLRYNLLLGRACKLLPQTNCLNVLHGRSFGLCCVRHAQQPGHVQALKAGTTVEAVCPTHVCIDFLA